MALEPGAIRSPDFELDRGLARLSRRNHEMVLNRAQDRPSGHVLADIDAAFHRLIGVSSRNRFFSAAIDRQNALRRALSYVRTEEPRELRSWAEHLEILTALERGEREHASELMKQHIAHAYERPGN